MIAMPQLKEMKDSEILEILTRTQRDSEWVSKNYEQLREKYESKAFAVKDGKVIEDAETVQDLLAELNKKGEDPAFLLIEVIPPRDASFIL